MENGYEIADIIDFSIVKKPVKLQSGIWFWKCAVLNYDCKKKQLESAGNIESRIGLGSKLY